MATYKRFEDLPVWKAAIELGVSVFQLTDLPDFRFKGDLVSHQLRRAALSVSNNIAEGFERGTTAELISFLYIARGSAGEVRSMFHFATHLGLGPKAVSAIEPLVPEAESVSRQIRAWADSLQNSDIPGQRRLTDQSRAAFDSRRRAEAFQNKLREAREQRLKKLAEQRHQEPESLNPE